MKDKEQSLRGPTNQ